VTISNLRTPISQKSSQEAAETCSYIQPTYDSIRQTSNDGHD
jgi:hypothetical protein